MASSTRNTKEPVYSAISTRLRGIKSRVSDLDDVAISLRLLMLPFTNADLILIKKYGLRGHYTALEELENL